MKEPRSIRQIARDRAELKARALRLTIVVAALLWAALAMATAYVWHRGLPPTEPAAVRPRSAVWSVGPFTAPRPGHPYTSGRLS
jgi:hypothetical protein